MKRMLGLLMVVGLVIGVGCGDDESSPTSSQQDTYREAILGTWKWHDSLHWTFNADGTVAVHYGDDVEETKNWSIDGSTLTITNLEDDTIDGYPHVIISISSTQFVYIYKFDPSDGSGTIEEEVTLTR